MRAVNAVSAFLVVLALCPAASPRAAGEADGRAGRSAPVSPGGEVVRLLELRKAWITLQDAKKHLELVELLNAEGLASKVESQSARSAFGKAQVEYEQTFVSVSAAAPRLTILSAVKTRMADGRKKVRLTLRNPVPSIPSLERLGIPEEAVPISEEIFHLGDVRDLSVSLEVDGTTISQPYEIYLPRLKGGGEATLEFDLLKDVETVGVALAHAGGRELRTIYLHKDASVNLVSIQTLEFSQEADLGTEAVFPLELEHFAGGDGVFRLSVVGLPQPIHHEFVDPESGARLSQIKFTEGGAVQRLALRLRLPEVAGQGVEIDRPIKFLAAVAPPAFRTDPPGGTGPAEGAPEESSRAGEAHLEIVPRGVGRIVVIAANLFQEIRPDERASLELRIRNEGTRPLSNVLITQSLPLHWQGTIEPKLVPSLAPGAEQRIELGFDPPEEVVMGEYALRIHVKAASGGRQIEHPDVEDRIRVTAPPRYLATVGLLGGLVVLLGGVIVAGSRMSRR